MLRPACRHRPTETFPAPGCLIDVGLGLFYIANILRPFGHALHPVNRFTGIRGNRSKSLDRLKYPPNFMAFKDLSGLFILKYPSDWELRSEDGVLAFSPCRGNFARVDVFPASPDLWERIAAAIRKEGGWIRLGRRTGSMLVGMRGRIELDSQGYYWKAYAWQVKDKQVVLSLGNVVDPQRSAVLRRYEEGILSAIRRGFVVRGA